jgi:hypothetical protein
VQAKTEYQERKFSDMYRDRSLCKDLNQGQRIVIKRRRRGLIEQFTQISSARFALKAPVLFARIKSAGRGIGLRYGEFFSLLSSASPLPALLMLPPIDLARRRRGKKTKGPAKRLDSILKIKKGWLALL